MSLRVTLAVEDWMDRGSLLEQEVKKAVTPWSCATPTGHGLPDSHRAPPAWPRLRPSRPLGMLPAGPLASWGQPKGRLRAHKQLGAWTWVREAGCDGRGGCLSPVSLCMLSGSSVKGRKQLALVRAQTKGTPCSPPYLPPPASISLLMSLTQAMPFLSSLRNAPHPAMSIQLSVI